MILELHVLPHLDAYAVGSLARTCSALRSLTHSKTLDSDWWRRAVQEKLSPLHPVLHSQETTLTPELARSALVQYAQASARMTAGQYTESAGRMKGDCPRVSPDCTKVATLKRTGIGGMQLYVYKLPTLELIFDRRFTFGTSCPTWAHDGLSLTMVCNRVESTWM
ncbi:hypothetical protein WJX73_005309 [Symbiochloris irregularis]|uniref:F-box domain-containing protein n=1 Tax=Symbiochloris irregularis TaxID=706552 RepID=A0AAW1NNS5_9CHLO